jgi:hypothetical protein
MTLLTELHSGCMLLALPANIRLGGASNLLANILDYLGTKLITARKKFYEISTRGGIHSALFSS